MNELTETCAMSVGILSAPFTETKVWSLGVKGDPLGWATTADGGWLFGEAIEAPVPLLAGLQLAALGGVAEPGFDTSSDPALIADAIIPGIVLDDLAAEGTGEDLRG